MNIKTMNKLPPSRKIVIHKNKVRLLHDSANDAVSVLPLLESFEQSKRNRSSDDEDPSLKRRCLEEEEEDEECEDGAVSVELSLNSDQSIRRRSTDDEETPNDAVSIELSLNSDQSMRRRSTDDEETPNDAVSIELSLNSDQSIRRRFPDDKDSTLKHECCKEEEEEYAKDLAFYKPWVDNKNPSSSSPSVDEFLALLLVNLSHGQQVKSQSKLDSSHMCDVCGKSFASYQALGGHKASHRVKSPQPLLENAIVDKTRPKMLPSGKIHKCDICHSVFPTGQALGGHKRRHYEGVIGGGDKLRLGNDSITTNVKDTRRLIIDLNEPALPEIDEDDGQEVEEIQE